MHEAGDWLASIALAPLAWLAPAPGPGASSCAPAQAKQAHELAGPPASAACGSSSQPLQAADPALHPGPTAGPAKPGPRAQSPDPGPDARAAELRGSLIALNALAAMAAGLTATGPAAMRAGTAQRLLAGLGTLLAAPGGGGVRAEAACAMHRRDIAWLSHTPALAACDYLKIHAKPHIPARHTAPAQHVVSLC